MKFKAYKTKFGKKGAGDLYFMILLFAFFISLLTSFWMVFNHNSELLDLAKSEQASNSIEYRDNYDTLIFQTQKLIDAHYQFYLLKYFDHSIYMNNCFDSEFETIIHNNNCVDMMSNFNEFAKNRFNSNLNFEYRNDSVFVSFKNPLETQYSLLAKNKIKDFEDYYLSNDMKFRVNSKINFLENSDIYNDISNIYTKINDYDILALMLRKSNFNNDNLICLNDREFNNLMNKLNLNGNVLFNTCDVCNKDFSEFKTVRNDCKVSRSIYGYSGLNFLEIQRLSKISFENSLSTDGQLDIIFSKIKKHKRKTKDINYVMALYDNDNAKWNQTFLNTFETHGESQELFNSLENKFYHFILKGYLSHNLSDFDHYNELIKEELIKEFGLSFRLNTFGDEFLNYNYEKDHIFELKKLRADFDCNLFIFQDEDEIINCINEHNNKSNTLKFDLEAVELSQYSKLLSYYYSNQENCYILDEYGEFIFIEIGNETRFAMANGEMETLEDAKGQSVVIGTITDYPKCKELNNFAYIKGNYKSSYFNHTSEFEVYYDFGIKDINEFREEVSDLS